MSIAVVLLASTPSLPAERPVDDERDTMNLRVARHVNGSFTIHSLLRGRLATLLQLAGALEALDRHPEPQLINGTRTIIDEPDPAGLNRETDPPATDEGDESAEDPGQEQEDAANESSQPLREFG
jgi:hypothetical protein